MKRACRYVYIHYCLTNVDCVGAGGLQDTSSGGTWLNGRKLEKSSLETLSSGNELHLVHPSFVEGKVFKNLMYIGGSLQHILTTRLLEQKKHCRLP